MEKVTGIGGSFFHAKEAGKLARWYRDHLGIDPVPKSYSGRPWLQEAGPTAFNPYTPDPGAKGPPWSVNFRVRDLPAIVAQLRAAGIEVTVDPERYPNGTFAHLEDPEGNPIELWQPMGDEETERPPPTKR